MDQILGLLSVLNFSSNETMIIGIIGIIIFFETKNIKLNQQLIQNLTDLHNEILRHSSSVEIRLSNLNEKITKIDYDLDDHQKEETKQHNDIGSTVIKLDKEVSVISTILQRGPK
jgi:hypothetical protein